MKTTSLMPNIARPIKIPKRNDERIILHFDYDCFYASVFENESPSLRSQPLGVKQKSILATCNYVARARGVRKLMLISEAQRICPDLVILNGEDLTRFRDVSKRLWSFLRSHAWSHRVERLGLDEVFLDVTDVVAYNEETLNAHALGVSFFHLDRADPERGFAFDASAFYGCVRASSAGTGANEKVRTNDGVVAVAVAVDVADPLCVRLMLASHLAGYLRHKLDTDFGYTSSGGIATSKLLAKLAGSVNKPNNQTTLLATGADGDDVVGAFMDAHGMRKIPGIGSRIAQLIEEHLFSRSVERRDRDRETTDVTVGEVRRYPGMSADLLEQILDRPGAERGSGSKVWNFLHGVDPSEVKEASDVPTQISIEDTYMSRPLQTPAEVVRELRALATSLVRRMRVDLTEANPHSSPNSTPRWLAYPKTLRLSTRTKPKQTVPPSSTSASATASAAEIPNYNRSSRSTPLPSFVFHLPPHPASTSTVHSLTASTSSPSPSTPSLTCEDLASRLVTDSLLPLFRRLHPERGGWNLALLNVCVTNMVPVAGAGAGAGGAASARDIGRMFRTQEDKLREWTVYDTSPAPASSFPAAGNGSEVGIAVEVAERVGRDAAEGLVIEEEAEEDEEDEEGGDVRYYGVAARSSGSGSGSPFLDDEGEDDIWEEREELDSQRCQICGHAIPVFALAAHQRFHSMDE